MKDRELREWMYLALGSMPQRVSLALVSLWRLDDTTYRIIREGRLGFVRGLALKMKTRALIQHDRILRGEL